MIFKYGNSFYLLCPNSNIKSHLQFLSVKCWSWNWGILPAIQLIFYSCMQGSCNAETERFKKCRAVYMLGKYLWIACNAIWIAGLTLGLRPANERRGYKVRPSPIGWAQTENQAFIRSFLRNVYSMKSSNKIITVIALAHPVYPSIIYMSRNIRRNLGTGNVSSGWP